LNLNKQIWHRRTRVYVWSSGMGKDARTCFFYFPCSLYSCSIWCYLYCYYCSRPPLLRVRCSSNKPYLPFFLLHLIIIIIIIFLCYFSISGENKHFGTPTNPAIPSRLPGGSSSGAAVAVAANFVDFSLGQASSYIFSFITLN